MQQRTTEQVVDVPVPQVVEGIIEQIVDVPVPEVVEEIVDAATAGKRGWGRRH